MQQKKSKKKKALFDPAAAEGQKPLNGNEHSDLQMFALMNMEVSEGSWCLRVINQHGLEGLFENSYQMLREISVEPVTEHPRRIAELAPGILCGVMVKIRETRGVAEKYRLIQATIKLPLALIIAFSNGNKKYSKNILEVVNDRIDCLCDQLNLDSSFIREHLNIESSGLPEWIHSYGEEIETYLKDPECRYIWNDHYSLAELAHQLKNENLVKRKKDVFDLFNTPSEDLLVEWDFTRRAQLAYLLYRLFTDGYCYIRGSKGYFAYAEQHFTGFKGEPFPKESLRKLSYKINKEPNKHQDVIRQIEGILESVGGG